MRIKHFTVNQKFGVITILFLTMLVLAIICLNTLVVGLVKGDSVNESFTSLNSNNVTAVKKSQSTTDSDNYALDKDDDLVASDYIIPDEPENNKWIIEVVSIVIMVVVLLIFLMIFRLWNIRNSGSERERLSTVVPVLTQRGVRIENSFLISSNEPNPKAKSTSYIFNYPINPMTQDYLNFRCWRCNAPIETKNFCPYCGWMESTRRVVGYWGFFN